MGTDLFELDKETQWIVFQDMLKRRSTTAGVITATAASITTVLKTIFSCHGIPSILISNNGDGKEKEFAESYGFLHITSSPYHL